MRKLVVALFVLAALGLAAPPAQAGSFTWADIAFSTSASPGVVYDDIYATGWATLPANLSGFTYNAANWPNDPGLGSIVFTFSGAGTHYVAGFFDYQYADPLNNNGLFDETVDYFPGSSGLAPGWSVQADDSFGSNIWLDFLAFNATTPLANILLLSPPYDVAVALGYAVTLNPGDPDKQVTFTVGLTAPTAGWYIQHLDPLSGQSIYFSATAVDLMGPVIPEPSTLVLLALGLAVAGRRLCRRSS